VGDNVPQKSAMPSDFAKPPVNLLLLTPRQAEVLRCFVDTPHEPPIARRLGMKAKTVERHLYNIQQKLQVTCRVELMKVALFALRGSLGDGTTIRESLTTKTSEND
jgi:DNA-binding NarL/FixJ family response regulator